jgi:hypothetical protein
MAGEKRRADQDPTDNLSKVHPFHDAFMALAYLIASSGYGDLRQGVKLGRAHSLGGQPKETMARGLDFSVYNRDRDTPAPREDPLAPKSQRQRDEDEKYDRAGKLDMAEGHAYPGPRVRALMIEAHNEERRRGGPKNPQALT